MKNYVEKRKADVFYRKAKSENYRARSAYKLLELQEKFNIIKKNDAVVDCGAAPGSWSQVALEFAGKDGLVIGIDILPVAKLTDRFTFIQGDLTSEGILEKIRAVAKGVDVVISDAAPEFSGIKTIDMGKAHDLNLAVLALAVKILKTGGKFLCKCFQSSDFQGFVKEVKKHFADVMTAKPAASQKSSPEIYVIGIRKR